MKKIFFIFFLAISFSANAVITISPSTISGLNTGVYFKQALTASGASVPYIVFQQSGTLPAGTAITYINGQASLSGTPSTAATYTFSLTARDGTGATGSQAYTVTVTAGGTVTSVAINAGSNISVSGSPITSTGTITVTNTAPDRTVTISAGSNISITSAYPSFTVTNTASPSQWITATSPTTAITYTVGSVGIGTMTPANQLEIVTGDYVTSLSPFFMKNSVWGNGARFNWEDNAGTMNFQIGGNRIYRFGSDQNILFNTKTSSAFTIAIADGGVSNSETVFQVYGGAPSLNRFVFSQAGNVGIGIDNTPSAKLQVVGSGATSATYSMKIQNSALTSLLTVRDDGVVAIGTTQTAAIFGDVNATSVKLGSNSIRYNTAGNSTVGIACNDIANYRFSIQGTGATSSSRSLYIKDFNGVDLFYVRDDGYIFTPGIHNNANAATGTVAMLASGTYTPTITDSANTSARTAYQSQWTRVGNVVTVSGVADVDPTNTLTITIIKITLPVTSNFSAAGNCRGTANCGVIAGQSAAILETTSYTSDFALMKWNTTDITNQPMSYTFIYLVQ